MVPASTMETYMMALRGEYCMAMRFHGPSIAVEAGFQLLPGGVDPLGPGQGVELIRLDAMDELAGAALGGNDVVPAAADQSLIGEAEDGGGERIAMVMVVEQPRIDAGALQRRLDSFEVHGT